MLYIPYFGLRNCPGRAQALSTLPPHEGFPKECKPEDGRARPFAALACYTGQAVRGKPNVFTNPTCGERVRLSVRLLLSDSYPVRRTCLHKWLNHILRGIAVTPTDTGPHSPVRLLWGVTSFLSTIQASALACMTVKLRPVR